MDSISSFEFHRIFNRVSDSIDLKGKFTEEAIEKELKKARDNCKRLFGQAETSQERARYRTAKVQFDNLIWHGFARRTIHEAVFNPRGLVAMTLRYGKAEAKKRILAQRVAQIRFTYRRPTIHRY